MTMTMTMTMTIARIAQKPWCASATLKAVHTQFTAWFSTIEHSNLLQGWYEEFQKEQLDTAKVTLQKSLSFAPHRFDSCSKPFAVAVLTMPAVILTAVKAVNERRQTHGKHAKAFLEFISSEEGCERLALAGMLADAADEAMLLTRAFDCENTDIALIHAELQEFLQNIKFLFIDQQCTTLGFTALMLETVKQQYVWFDGDGAHSIGRHGGLSANALAACLRHMAAWTSVACKVISAEFPDFEVLSAFRIFALDVRDGGRAPSHGRHRNEMVAEPHHSAVVRLCQCLGLDAEKFMEEHGRLEGVAQYLFTHEKLSNFQAWRRAVHLTSRARGNRPVTALGPALEAYGAWVCSTSGVEQAWSMRDWVNPPRRGLAEHHEMDHLQIVLAKLEPCEEQGLFSDAADVWTKLYGKPRRCGAIMPMHSLLSLVISVHSNLTHLQPPKQSLGESPLAHASVSRVTSTHVRRPAARLQQEGRATWF